MSTCLIISGGSFHPIETTIEADYIIACDAGYDNAIRNNLIPDLIIGDFDSYNGNISESAGNIPVLSFPVRKDDSDTMLAVKYAYHHGYNKIVIACALGGRMDHTVANLQALNYIASKGIEGLLISDTENMYALHPGKHIFPRKPHRSLSLFATCGKVRGITITGSKYDVTDVTLLPTDPMGLSNDWVEDEITVSYTEGILLAIESSI